MIIFMFKIILEAMSYKPTYTDYYNRINLIKSYVCMIFTRLCIYKLIHKINIRTIFHSIITVTFTPFAKTKM